ncbi:MAG TPA: FAD-binding oxidoreductase [Vicinamibacterales bacterium]|jgi:glycine/D-amino acid oxidase-like deaminating enzyme|nr:FAD-binding oxidoreductase [Vicinamibacterales bacterium]
MPRLRLGRSYWLDTFQGAAPKLPPLRGTHRADVAIVGGGVTGCAAALLFARAGATVALAESARIGRGSTAASTALLMQEPDADFVDLLPKYGTAAAMRIWRRCRTAVTDMRRTLDALGTPALRSLPSVYLTRDPDCVSTLRREAAARQRCHLAGRFVEGGSLHALIGFGAHGAIVTPGNAQVDPYRACLALARAAASRGASLFEGSAVTRIRGSRDGVEVTLERGRVLADWAVIATGYATPQFERLRARFRMMNTYAIATPRLDAALRKRLRVADVMMWDTDRPYHYLRWTDDGRLLFGGRDRPRLAGAIRPAALKLRAMQLMSDLRSWYPALGAVHPEYAWEGLFAVTPDGLPYIGRHRLYPRQLFALGYGGNGMTLGFFAAQAVVRLARGRPGPDDELFGFARGRR